MNVMLCVLGWKAARTRLLKLSPFQRGDIFSRELEPLAIGASTSEAASR
jgi:hypothetical protein